MKEFRDRVTRPCGKPTDFFLLALILSVLLLVLGEVFSLFVFNTLHIEDKLIGWTGSDNIGTFLGNYLFTFGVWVAFLLVAVIFKGNRPMLKALAPNRSLNNLKGILLGLLLGFGTNGFCVLMSWLLIAFLICVFIQSSSEEVLDRLYVYQKLRRRYRNPLVAIILNSLVFMSLHIPNPGFTAIAGSQIFLVAIIFSMFVYYYDGIWVAFWFHAAWNYTQNIIFGLPNSGIISEYSLFKLEAVSARNGLFYDVKFGVEGSIGASLVLIAVIIVLFLINRKKPERRDYWAEAEAEAAARQIAAAGADAPKHMAT